MPSDATTFAPPALCDAYRAILSPDTSRDSLAARHAAAEQLAVRAFEEGDRVAWEIVQAVEWRLVRRGNLRPTSPGDVLVLDTLYRAEEATLPVELPPTGLTPKEFLELLSSEITKHSSADGKLIQLMQTGDLAPQDWKFFGYQWLTSAIDFTRQIAVCSLALPREKARLLYLNLFDEIGRGDWSRAHWVLLSRFLTTFGIDADDEPTILAWTAPEILAMANLQNRLLAHQEPGWGLGSLFLAERLVPSELGQVRKAVLRMQLAANAVAFFDDHVETDVAHANDWQTVIEDSLVTYEDQRIVYTAALQRGRAQKRAWSAAFDAWRTWKATGEPPHVRFAELDALL
jgi:hypothetical protein